MFSPSNFRRCPPRGAVVCVVLLALLLSPAIIRPAPVTAAAPGETRPISLFVDGSRLDLDVPPAIIEDRTLVPLRGVFRALGAEVAWDPATRTVRVAGAVGDIVLTVDSLEALTPSGPVTLEVGPRIVAGRTMVPLRFVSEALDATVAWDGASRTITIDSSTAALGLPLLRLLAQDPADWHARDVELLAGWEPAIATGEAVPATLQAVAALQRHRTRLLAEGARHHELGFCVIPPDLAPAVMALDHAVEARLTLVYDYFSRAMHPADGRGGGEDEVEDEDRNMIPYYVPLTEQDGFDLQPAEPDYHPPVDYLVETVAAFNGPPAMFQGLEVFALPFAVTSPEGSEYYCSGFNDGVRAFVASSPGISLAAQAFGRSATHELGHLVHSQWMAAYADDPRDWEAYLKIKGIKPGRVNFEAPSPFEDDWQRSPLECLAEDARIVLGSEAAASEPQATDYDDPRDVPGQVEALRGLFAALFRGPAGTDTDGDMTLSAPAVRPVTRLATAVDVSGPGLCDVYGHFGDGYAATTDSFVTVSGNAPAGTVRVDLDRDGETLVLMKVQAVDGRFSLRVPLLAGPGAYRLSVSLSDNREEGTWWIDTDVCLRGTAPAGPYAEPDPDPAQARLESRFVTAPRTYLEGLEPGTMIDVFYDVKTYVGTVQVPPDAAVDGLWLPLTGGDGPYDIWLTRGEDLDGLTVVVDSDQDPWAPEAGREMWIHDRALRVPAGSGTTVTVRGEVDRDNILLALFTASGTERERFNCEVGGDGRFSVELLTPPPGVYAVILCGFDDGGDELIYLTDGVLVVE